MIPDAEAVQRARDLALVLGLLEGLFGLYFWRSSVTAGQAWLRFAFYSLGAGGLILAFARWWDLTPAGDRGVWGLYALCLIFVGECAGIGLVGLLKTGQDRDLLRRLPRLPRRKGAPDA